MSERRVEYSALQQPREELEALKEKNGTSSK